MTKTKQTYIDRETIIKYQKRYHHSNRSLAKKAGVSRSTIDRIVNGKSMIAKELFDKISQNLYIAPEDLSGQTNKNNHAKLKIAVSQLAKYKRLNTKLLAKLAVSASKLKELKDYADKADSRLVKMHEELKKLYDFRNMSKLAKIWAVLTNKI